MESQLVHKTQMKFTAKPEILLLLYQNHDTIKNLAFIGFHTESQTATGTPVLHVRSQRRCGRPSIGRSRSLPDRTRPRNRPDRADRRALRHLGWTISPTCFLGLKYGLANDEGVSGVVFIDFETTERIVHLSQLI